MIGADGVSVDVPAPVENLERLADNLDQWQELVMRCVAVKAGVVSEDEREAGKRAALNLGHTLGHALEAATAYAHFLHGEAVAWGLLAAAKLGRRHGLLSSAGEEAISSAVSNLGPLPSLDEVDALIAEALGGSQRPLWLMPILESALGIEHAFDIARASDRVAALTIGLEDYSADIGVPRSAEGVESNYARRRTINAAKAAATASGSAACFGSKAPPAFISAQTRRSDIPEASSFE